MNSLYDLDEIDSQTALIWEVYEKSKKGLIKSLPMENWLFIPESVKSIGSEAVLTSGKCRSAIPRLLYQFIQNYPGEVKYPAAIELFKDPNSDYSLWRGMYQPRSDGETDRSLSDSYGWWYHWLGLIKLDNQWVVFSAPDYSLLKSNVTNPEEQFLSQSYLYIGNDPRSLVDLAVMGIEGGALLPQGLDEFIMKATDSSSLQNKAMLGQENFFGPYTVISSLGNAKNYSVNIDFSTLYA